MLTFALCLGCAGVVLSLFARLPALLAVVGGTVLAILAAGMLSLFGVALVSSTLGNVLVAIIALQCGYGLGIVARAVLQFFLTTRAESRFNVAPMRNAAIRPEPDPHRGKGD